MKKALVTGGNRGIGLEICRQLESSGFKVIMGTRSLSNLPEDFKQTFKNTIPKELDVTKEDTIITLYNFIKYEFGSLDILINNAGIGEFYYLTKPSRLKILRNYLDKKSFMFRIINKSMVSSLRRLKIMKQKTGASAIPIESVKKIMDTNFYGAWRTIQVFIPLLAKTKNAQIINVSSGMGELNSLTGIYPGYSLSKASLNALTIMLSNELKEQKITVNAVCPGWVKTRVGGPNAPRTVEQGADTVVWLATSSPTPSGKFFRDRKEINW